MKHTKNDRLLLLAAALVLVPFPALALEINNNSGYELYVQVACGGKEDQLKVPKDQVGDCPPDVCTVGTECVYEIDADSDGTCSGTIDGGSGLQVNSSDGQLTCAQVEG